MLGMPPAKLKFSILKTKVGISDSTLFTKAYLTEVYREDFEIIPVIILCKNKDIV